MERLMLITPSSIPTTEKYTRRVVSFLSLFLLVDGGATTTTHPCATTLQSWPWRPRFTNTYLFSKLTWNPTKAYKWHAESNQIISFLARDGVSGHPKSKPELKIRTRSKNRFGSKSISKPKSADTRNPIGYPESAFAWQYVRAISTFL